MNLTVIYEPFTIQPRLSSALRKKSFKKILVGCIEVKCHFTSQGHITAVSDAHDLFVFPCFLTPVPTLLSF